jgi:hypothetical protein
MSKAVARSSALRVVVALEGADQPVGHVIAAASRNVAASGNAPIFDGNSFSKDRQTASR